MDDCDGFYRMAGEDLCHLRDIPLNIRIQFRAEDDHDLILQELRMKPCVSEGYTVSSNEQIGIIEIRRRLELRSLSCTGHLHAVPILRCLDRLGGRQAWSSCRSMLLAADPGQVAEGRCVPGNVLAGGRLPGLS